MKRVELKVARIGNSRGARIPAPTLERYRIGPTVMMEERSDGILLRPQGPPSSKLSWEDTAREMADASENWADWETASSDGLEGITWETRPARRVAERKAAYNKKQRRTRR